MALWDIPAQVDSWVEVSERGAALVLRIGGELDAATRARVEPAIVAAMTTASSVVLDLSELTFCDSSGIAMFIAAHEQANKNGTRLAIRHPRPPVRRVIELTGLDTVIPLESQPGTVRRTTGSA
jgi:anti-sigma B factor antagonist